MKPAPVAEAMGVSSKCVYRWLERFDAEGDAGLSDRSSRPHRMPTKTPPEVEAEVLAARAEHRRGQDWLGAELGVPARTVGRILERNGVLKLSSCDPMTGEVIRASKTTAVRYERDPGPASWSTWTTRRSGGSPTAAARAPMVVRWERAQRTRRPASASTSCTPSSTATAAWPTSDEQAAICAAFFARAVAAFADDGINRIEAVMTDNHWGYTKSDALAAHLDRLRAQHITIKPHCPWQNGKVERFNRTLQTEWADRQVFHNNAERTAALAPWLETYNTRRRHSPSTATTAHQRPAVTNLMAEYT